MTGSQADWTIKKRECCAQSVETLKALALEMRIPRAKNTATISFTGRRRRIARLGELAAYDDQYALRFV